MQYLFEFQWARFHKQNWGPLCIRHGAQSGWVCGQRAYLLKGADGYRTYLKRPNCLSGIFAITGLAGVGQYSQSSALNIISCTLFFADASALRAAQRQVPIDAFTAVKCCVRSQRHIARAKNVPTCEFGRLVDERQERTGEQRHRRKPLLDSICTCISVAEVDEWGSLLCPWIGDIAAAHEGNDLLSDFSRSCGVRICRV